MAIANPQTASISLETDTNTRELAAAFLRAQHAQILEDLSERLTHLETSDLLPVHRALLNLAAAHIQKTSPHHLISGIRRALAQSASRSRVPALISGQMTLWIVLHKKLRTAEEPHLSLSVFHAVLALVGDTVDGVIGALLTLGHTHDGAATPPDPEWDTLVAFGRMRRESQALNRLIRDMLDTRDTASMFRIFEEGVLNTFHLRSLLVALVSHEEESVEVIYAHHQDPATSAPLGWRFDLSHPDILSEVARTGKMDEIGQALTAVKIGLQAAQALSDPAAAVQKLGESIAVVEDVLQQVRDLSLALRPAVLDELGLTAALRWLVDRQGRLAGLTAQVMLGPLQNRLPSDVETTCFRIAQEALTNVARHAQAQRVRVELQQQEADLCLSIGDDGVGFDVDAAMRRSAEGDSLGLLGMGERALLVGGRLHVQSAPGQGTEIRARFPMNLLGPHQE